MKNKTKIFLGSAFAVTAGVVTPLVTLVSCGDKKPTSAPIVIEQKEAKTENGSPKVHFTAKLAKPLTQGKDILVGVVDRKGGTDGWTVSELAVIDGWGKSEVTLEAEIVPISNDIPKIGTYVDFDAKFTCTTKEASKPVWEHNVTGLKATYVCKEGDLSADEKKVATNSRSTFATIVFSKNGTVFGDELEPQFDIKEQSASIDNIKMGKLTETADKAYIEFELIVKGSAEIKDGDGVTFDLRLIAKSGGTVAWQQTIPELKIFYSEALVGTYDLKVKPIDVGAGSITKSTPYVHEIKFGIWKNMDIVNIASCSVVNKNTDDFDVELSEFEFVEEKTDYKVIKANATIKFAADKTPENVDEQWINFDLDFKYQGLAIVYPGDTIGKFEIPYVKAKAAQPEKPIVTTDAGVNNANFEMNVIDLHSIFGEVAKVEVKPNQDESKSDALVTYNGQDIDVSKEKLDLNFVLSPKTALEKLKHGDTAYFNITLTGKTNLGEPVWKQTITGDQADLQLIYKGIAEVLVKDIETRTDKTAAQWGITVPNEKYIIDTTPTKTYFDIDEGKSNIGVTLKGCSGEGTSYAYAVEVKALKDTDPLPYNGVAVGTLHIEGTDDEGKSFVTEELCSVAYNGTISYLDGSVDKETELGKTSADFNFLLQTKKAEGKVLKWTITPVSEGSTKGVDIKTKTGTVNITAGFDGKVKLTPELVREDGALVNKDKARFMVSFEIEGLMKKELGTFSLTYTGNITDGPTQPIVTEPGKTTATLKFTGAKDWPTTASTIVPTAESIEPESVKVDFIGVTPASKSLALTCQISREGGFKDGEVIAFNIKFVTPSWTERYFGVQIKYTAAQLEPVEIQKTATVLEKDHTKTEAATLVIGKTDGSFAAGDSATLEIQQGSTDAVKAYLVTDHIEFKGGEETIEPKIYLGSDLALEDGMGQTFGIKVHFVPASGTPWDQTIENCQITAAAKVTIEKTEIDTPFDETTGNFKINVSQELPAGTAISATYDVTSASGEKVGVKTTTFELKAKATSFELPVVISNQDGLESGDWAIFDAVITMTTPGAEKIIAPFTGLKLRYVISFTPDAAAKTTDKDGKTDIGINFGLLEEWNEYKYTVEISDPTGDAEIELLQKEYTIDKTKDQKVLLQLKPTGASPLMDGDACSFNYTITLKDAKGGLVFTSEKKTFTATYKGTVVEPTEEEKTLAGEIPTATTDPIQCSFSLTLTNPNPSQDPKDYTVELDKFETDDKIVKPEGAAITKAISGNVLTITLTFAKADSAEWADDDEATFDLTIKYNGGGESTDAWKDQITGYSFTAEGSEHVQIDDWTQDPDPELEYL